MDSDKSIIINKLFNTLNEINNKECYLTVESTSLSNELLETLKVIENCTICKGNIKYFHGSINGMENLLAELEKKKEDKKYINEIDFELNQKVLCESCERKKIEELTDKCGSKKMAGFLYKCKLNADSRYGHIRWIPFNEFENINHLAEGGFGEVHKATWINDYYDYDSD